MPETSASRHAVEAAWRIESARVVAALTRMTGDLSLAEELAQDAFVAALERWPESGIPDKPGAWLMTHAKRRAIDRHRRDRRSTPLGFAEPASPLRDPGAADFIEDDVLRLIFMACRPELSREARAALTLRLVCGLSTGEIARAFLVPEPTIAQRIVRAKRTLTEQRAPFDVPGPDELGPRLPSVLEVIYLLFNEGYTANAGDDWLRPALCDEAGRLARILAAHMPDEPEVHGLLALLELQASRFPARTDAEGRPILLPDQDRARWDRLRIRRGLGALETSLRSAETLGPYTLQAAIAACHARARTADETDWARIVTFYEALLRIAPSPIVALNHAVAVGMAHGPHDAIRLLDDLATEPALADYHLLPSVRGEFLRRLGRVEDAKREFERAASMTDNSRERDLLLERAHTLTPRRP
jgi:RNA polymerase sigma factor (sigma-70 family)